MTPTRPTPSPLEVAAALRSTAEFCRDPESPKNLYAVEAFDADDHMCLPTDPDAAKWCAIGYFKHVLSYNGSFRAIVPGSAAAIHAPFDEGRYEACALNLEERAAELEASIPSTPEPALELASA